MKTVLILSIAILAAAGVIPVTSDIGGPAFVAVAPVKVLPGGMSNAATGYTVQNVSVLDRASSKALSVESGIGRLQLNFSATF